MDCQEYNFLYKYVLFLFYFYNGSIYEQKDNNLTDLLTYMFGKTHSERSQEAG